MQPTFLGIEHPYDDPQNASAVILPVPYDMTSTYVKGADRGPAALIQASTQVELYDIPTRTEPHLRGIATREALHSSDSPEVMCDRVQQAVAEILDNHQLPIVLGGEHSVSIGAIRAAAAKFKGCSVLQIDAHGDTREEYEGSRCNHACVMARARELCDIVQVGIRAIDRSEAEALDESRVFFAHDINASSDDAWMDRAAALLADHVYLTIDLDGFDPAYIPATGTPEPGGLDWRTVNELIRRVIASGRTIVGFDVVELCPQPGEHASAFLAAKLVHRILAMTWA